VEADGWSYLNLAAGVGFLGLLRGVALVPEEAGLRTEEPGAPSLLLLGLDASSGLMRVRLPWGMARGRGRRVRCGGVG
jgi:hypothetical protein